MRSLNNKDRKTLAAYYTPKSVTDSLCTWAVQSNTDTVLEPSFGGCGFLISLHQRLSQLGCEQPIKNLYGCDIDVNAFSVLNSLFDSKLESHFVQSDFLFTNESTFDKKLFSVIVGNPPYLSISVIKDQKERYWDVLKKYNFSFKKRASLWSYFLIHSLSFLDIGGRMAWVLPNSLLFTEYGKAIQKILSNSFEKVDIIKIDQRFFLDEGTDEKTLFLLCEGYKQGQCTINISNYNTLNEGLNAVNDTSYREVKESPNHFNLDAFSEVDIFSLSDICDIKIGIVIGASKYLIYKQSEIELHDLNQNEYYPVFCRASHINGLLITSERLNLTAVENKTYLVNFSVLINNKEKFNKVYDSLPQTIFQNNVTFSNRPNWYGYDDYKIPDAFLVYFNARGPRILINPDKLNSTNSIHRLYFKEIYNNDIFKKLISISSVTSFTRFHAETIGRSYGAGVLKLEPSDAKKLIFCCPKTYSSQEVNQIFDQVNELLECDNIDKATEVADNFIFASVSISEINKIRFQLSKFKNNRYP